MLSRIHDCLPVVFPPGERDKKFEPKLVVPRPAVVAPGILATERAAAQRVHVLLDKVVPMQFPQPTPLIDILGYLGSIKTSGVGIYVDPDALADVNAGIETRITIATTPLPLKYSLAKALRPLGLTVSNTYGLLTISDPARVGARVDFGLFLQIGHSLFALLAGLLGGGLGRRVWSREMRRNERDFEARGA